MLQEGRLCIESREEKKKWLEEIKQKSNFSASKTVTTDFDLN